MPLFLFNYSERKLHGVFEAAGKGRMLIDRYGWTDGTEPTQFPAQVQICVQCRCHPLPEEKFKRVIEDNYYVPKHFWFELDHGQANRLISLFKPITVSPNMPVLQNTQWLTPSSSLPLDDPWGGGGDEEFKRPESEFGFSEDDLLANEYIQPSDTHEIEKEEVKPEEVDIIFMKLKELAIPRENQHFSLEDNVSSNPDVNPSSETQLGSERAENRSSPFKNEHIIAQLEQEVKELTRFKEAHTEKNNYLEKKLMEALSEILVLKDRLTLLESSCNITHTEETVTNPPDELNLDPKDSLFLIGGYDGESSLAAMDLFSTSQNMVKSLKPMSSVRLYSSAVEFSGEIYVLGGGDSSVWYDKVESYDPVHDNWTLRPSLNQKKGSLSSAALDGKLFAFGGGNGVDCFSQVEMLDLDIGRWIPTRSMIEKVGLKDIWGSLYR